MTRGHSNVYVDRIEQHSHVSDKAMIPIAGGARITSVKDLPPLALSRAEWEEIGKRMGWLNTVNTKEK